MANSEEKASRITPSERPKCGIIRPISAMPDYQEQHWKDIAAIVEATVREAEFEPNLVSDAPEIGIIQARIVQNLHDYPIAICDVSGANPNVMFELGMRLAFDKATIIIKDERTPYNFDTSPLEQLSYPRDLRYPSIVKFKGNLREKLLKTYETQKEKGYSPFLKHFGEFVPAKLGEEEVGSLEYIQKMFISLADNFAALSAKFDRYQIEKNRSRNEEEQSPWVYVQTDHGLQEKRIAGSDLSQSHGIQKKRRYYQLIRELEQEKEKLRNANSALAVSEANGKIATLEGMLASLDSE